MSKHPIQSLLSLSVLLAATVIASAQVRFAEYYNTPYQVPALSADTFPVIAWGFSPSSAEQLRTMKEAGFNVSGLCRVKDLRLVQAAGLKCFVNDPRANKYNWKQLPSDAEIRRNLASLKKEIGNNPAAMGFFLEDEPDASRMAGIGHVADLLHEIMPDKLPYVNLLPSVVKPEEHGAPSYAAYLRMLPEVIHQPFLSYDNYSLLDGDMQDSFYTNLEIVRQVSLEQKVPFWNIVLANAHRNYMDPTPATLALQMYSTLAYGGLGIQYFTYMDYEEGNFRLSPVDQFGNKSPTWDMVRYVNNELHVLAPILVKLHSTGVYHVPDVPEGGHPLSESRLVDHIKATQLFVAKPAASRLLVGEFKGTNGSDYLMVVNKSLTESFDIRVHLKQGNRKLYMISRLSGQEKEGRGDWLRPGGAQLFRVGE